MEILRYVAFSADPAGGNPAGVVLDAAGVSDADIASLRTCSTRVTPSHLGVSSRTRRPARRLRLWAAICVSGAAVALAG